MNDIKFAIGVVNNIDESKQNKEKQEKLEQEKLRR